MHKRQKLKLNVIYRVRYGTRFALRWWMINDRKYRWKWRAANGTVAVFFLASVALPIVQHTWQNDRYVLSSSAADLVGKTDASLAKQLTYDAKTATYQFNKDALKTANIPTALQKNSTGAANKSNTKTYALDVPEDFSKGVTYHDTNSGLSFSLVPQFGALNAKTEQGHVVFPLDGGNQAVYTLKNNGLKEDIVVPKVTSDSMTFSYKLDLPNTLVAKVIPGSGGAIGIYSADPTLFGDISYGSNKDQAAVEKARVNGAKTFLVFGLPAPVVKAAHDGSTNGATARFSLDGQDISVIAENLSAVKSAITIDPSVVVTSTSDFQTNGNNSGMIDFSTSGQLTRGSLTGGSLSWTTGASATIATEGSSSVAYNGFLYIIGGRNRTISANYTTVQYSALNATTGVMGTWSTTTALPDSSWAAGTAVYDGYIYVVGGVSGRVYTGHTANTVTSDVLFAPVNTDGTIGAWSQTTSLPSVNYTEGVTAYNGYIYTAGGATSGSSATYKSDVLYAPLNGDGTVGSWTATTSLADVRIYPKINAYNGYVYVLGGADVGGFISDVQYAPINANGTIGAWIATNSFTGNRYGMSTDIYNGYIYLMGGLVGSTYKNDTQFAQVNANGSLGVWKTTGSFGQVESYGIGNVYNGYAYVGTGYDGTTVYTTMQYAKIDPAGIASSSSAVTLSNSRRGAAVVANNGYLYVLGGDANSAPITTNQIMMATLGSDGSIGSFVSQTNVYTTSRTLLAAIAVGGYLYVFGGCSSALGGCTTLGNDLATVYSAPLSGTVGTVGTWTAQTSFTTARYGLQAAVYGGYVYLVGGISASTFQNDVQYASLATAGTISAWTTASSNTISTARAAFGLAVEGPYLYVAGGCSAGTLVSCSTQLSDIQYAKLNSTGGGFAVNWASAGTTLPGGTGRFGIGLMVANGYMYVQGGYDGTTYYSDTQSIPIVAAGSISGSTWTVGASIANSCWGIGYTSYNGTLYSAGGINGSTTYANAYYTLVNNGGTGSLGAWTTNSNSLASQYPSGVAYGKAFASNGYMYYLGGQDSAVTTVYANVYYAAINSDGSLGTWNTTTSLNTSRSKFGVAVYGGYVYVANGVASLGPTVLTSSVEYAPILATGGLGSWTTSGNATNSARQFIDMTVYKGYLYTAGGTVSGTGLSDTQYAPINSDGSVGTWVDLTGTSSFTSARYDAGIIAYNGYLYVLGGESSGTQRNDVQYAPLNSDGSITASSWKYTTTLSFYTKYAQLAVFNGYLYITSGAFLLGSSGGSNQFANRFQDAPIRADGTLGNWQYSSTSAGNAHYQNGGVIYNGYLYRIAGFDGTTSYSDIQYSPLDSIDRTGQYSKLTDLGSLQNIQSVSYNGTLPNGLQAINFYAYDGNGVLVASGLPSTITSASSTACTSNVSSIRYVRMAITLDESQSTAVFPDFAATNTANITDYTINYYPGHPASNVRLRGGQTLEVGLLSGLDTCGYT